MVNVLLSGVMKRWVRFKLAGLLVYRVKLLYATETESRITYSLKLSRILVILLEI